MSSDRTDSPAPHDASPQTSLYDHSISHEEIHHSLTNDHEVDDDDAVNRRGGEDTASNVDSAIDQSITSSMADDEDSLLDATPAEIEERAMALLHGDDTPVIGNDSSSTGNVANDVGSQYLEELCQSKDRTSIENGPHAAKAASEEAQLLAHDKAITYLRKCLEKADETDWMYTTPAVFAAPNLLHSAKGHTSARLDSYIDEDALGYDGGVGATAAWLDQAVNLDAFGLDESTASSDTPDIEAPSTYGEHSMFADAGAASF